MTEKTEEFTVMGRRFYKIDGSVGMASNGPSAAAGAIQRLRDDNRKAVRLLDICCGCGVIGAIVRDELGPAVISELTMSDIVPANVEASRMALDNMGIRGEVFLSDGLSGIPKGRVFDVIVSNPPHCQLPENFNGEWTPSWIATVDENWKFHRHFYKNCHRYLAPGGEVWFIENKLTEVEEVTRKAVRSNPHMKVSRTEIVPDDPGYFWIISRRV